MTKLTNLTCGNHRHGFRLTNVYKKAAQAA